jgi:hypothetical protein
MTGDSFWASSQEDRSAKCVRQTRTVVLPAGACRQRHKTCRHVHGVEWEGGCQSVSAWVITWLCCYTHACQQGTVLGASFKRLVIRHALCHRYKYTRTLPQSPTAVAWPGHLQRYTLALLADYRTPCWTAPRQLMHGMYMMIVEEQATVAVHDEAGSMKTLDERHALRHHELQLARCGMARTCQRHVYGTCESNIAVYTRACGTYNGRPCNHRVTTHRKCRMRRWPRASKWPLEAHREHRGPPHPQPWRTCA